MMAVTMVVSGVLGARMEAERAVAAPEGVVVMAATAMGAVMAAVTAAATAAELVAVMAAARAAEATG